MARHGWLGIGCGALVAFAMTGGVAGAQTPAAAPVAAATDAVAAAKASPELVGALSKELGATPEQAAGAAGALFGVAKTRLKPAEFAQVATAVTGMDALLKAAPAPAAAGGGGGAAAAVSQLAGQAGGLASAASAFTKLGLKPDAVTKAIPVLTSFVGKSGGAGVASLLTGALK